MLLSDLLHGVEVLEISGAAETTVSGLHYDSRKIQPDNLFVAIRGEKTDGNRYIPQARERGAIAVASEASLASSGISAGGGTSPAAKEPPVWVQVRDARKTLALASANFYRQPAAGIAMVGVTGTNGKTTTTFLIDEILTTAGKKTALVGTIEYRLAGRRLASPHTTPESLDLQALLAQLREAGGSHATMEVSSHALAMDRVYGVPFAVAVFTNLTRDHLDFHGSMEAYFAEKKKLFTGAGAPPPKWALLNSDDPAHAALRGCGSDNVLTYGFGAEAQVRPEGEPPRSGEFVMATPWGAVRSRSRLVGRPNVYNLLAAASAALALGLPVPQVEAGLASLDNVPGRFERVEAGQPFYVVVDYAHTDDALRNLLNTARGLVGSRRVITVFGCGGDRDRTKRPLMAEAAGSLSDYVVITSDNPRSEDPLAIINDALPGLLKTGRRHMAEPDRTKAIRAALEQARAGDIVLIAGKGHETYQVIGNQTIHYDDREVARTVLRSMGYLETRESTAR